MVKWSNTHLGGYFTQHTGWSTRSPASKGKWSSHSEGYRECLGVLPEGSGLPKDGHLCCAQKPEKEGLVSGRGYWVMMYRVITHRVAGHWPLCLLGSVGSYCLWCGKPSALYSSDAPTWQPETVDQTILHFCSGALDHQPEKTTYLLLAPPEL